MTKGGSATAQRPSLSSCITVHGLNLNFDQPFRVAAERKKHGKMYAEFKTLVAHMGELLTKAGGRWTLEAYSTIKRVRLKVAVSRTSASTDVGCG